MEFYIMLYRVTVDQKKICYGKAGVASKNLQSDWLEVKTNIYDGYRTTFPTARRIEIEPIKATRVSIKKYAEFVMIASGAMN